jgi:hypothetical protein
MAVDIQNEPFLQARSLLQTPTGFDWLCGRAQTIKSVVTMVLEESSTFVACLHKQIPFGSFLDDVRKQPLMTPRYRPI